MGNSTIIELNHDLYSEIEKNPQKFVDAILKQLQHMDGNGTPIPGGHIIRGDSRYGEWYEEFSKMKKRWAK